MAKYPRLRLYISRYWYGRRLPNSERCGVSRGIGNGPSNHSPVGTRRGLVAFDFGGFLDTVVALSEGRLGAQQFVLLEESTALFVGSRRTRTADRSAGGPRGVRLSRRCPPRQDAPSAGGSSLDSGSGCRSPAPSASTAPTDVRGCPGRVRTASPGLTTSSRLRTVSKSLIASSGVLITPAECGSKRFAEIRTGWRRCADRVGRRMRRERPASPKRAGANGLRGLQPEYQFAVLVSWPTTVTVWLVPSTDCQVASSKPVARTSKAPNS